MYIYVYIYIYIYKHTYIYIWASHKIPCLTAIPPRALQAGYASLSLIVCIYRYIIKMISIPIYIYI